MKVKSEFKIGQMVYFAFDLHPRIGVVKEIRATETETSMDIQYWVATEEGIIDGWRGEDSIHATLAELKDQVLGYIEDIYAKEI